MPAPSSAELTRLTEHVLFEPLDVLARLAALVPPPRVDLTRYHGVFAPNSRYRTPVTPGRRSNGRHRSASDEPPPPPRRRAMSWAQRLKRVFEIDVSTCGDCGGPVWVIASIEDPAVIRRILAPLDAQDVSTQPGGDCRTGTDRRWRWGICLISAIGWFLVANGFP